MVYNQIMDGERMENRREEIREEIFEALLKIAVNRAMRREAEDMPSTEELRRLYPRSPALDKRVRKIINRYYKVQRLKRFLKIAGRVATVFCIIITLSFIILLGVLFSAKFF